MFKKDTHPISGYQVMINAQNSYRLERKGGIYSIVDRSIKNYLIQVKKKVLFVNAVILK